MALDIPTTEPSEIRAGDTVTWKKSLSDYPASTYTLKYELFNATKKISIVSTASGDDHLVSVPIATTDDYVAGTYQWISYVTTATERYEVGRGTIKILADVAASTTLTHDGRSHAKKALDAIEAVLEGRATKDQESYSIAGRSLLRTKIADLLAMRDYYRKEYNNELNAEKINQGKTGSGSISVRFTR